MLALDIFTIQKLIHWSLLGLFKSKKGPILGVCKNGANITSETYLYV